MTTVNERYNAVANLLFAKAVWGGNRFRQWFYPNLPRNYTVNKEVFTVITAKLEAGSDRTDQEIATEIYREKGG